MITYEGRRQVRFSESDPQGYMFYAHIFTWAHEALEDYWRRHERGWSFWFRNPEWAVPLRRAEAEYLKPMLAGEEYAIQLRTLKTGSTSISLEFTVTDASGATLAKANTIHVFVDRKTGMPTIHALPQLTQ